MAERDLNLRSLGRLVDVDPTHLSRVARGHKPVSPALASKVARELDLPEDYFAEVREAAIVDAVRTDPATRERLYGQLERQRKN